MIALGQRFVMKKTAHFPLAQTDHVPLVNSLYESLVHLLYSSDAPLKQKIGRAKNVSTTREKRRT